MVDPDRPRPGVLMRLRAAVPSLLALSLLTAIPAAHASGCGSSTDPAGDVPFKTLDMVSVKVVRNKTRKVNNIQFVMTLGSTDAKSEPVTTGGVSYYILFNIKGTGYKIWRHVEPIWPGGNDVYGGMYAKNGIQPKV